MHSPYCPGDLVIYTRVWGIRLVSGGLPDIWRALAYRGWVYTIHNQNHNQNSQNGCHFNTDIVTELWVRPGPCGSSGRYSQLPAIVQTWWYTGSCYLMCLSNSLPNEYYTGKHCNWPVSWFWWSFTCLSWTEIFLWWTHQSIIRWTVRTSSRMSVLHVEWVNGFCITGMSKFEAWKRETCILFLRFISLKWPLNWNASQLQVVSQTLLVIKMAHWLFQGIINMATSENTLAFDLLKDKVQYLWKLANYKNITV